MSTIDEKSNIVSVFDSSAKSLLKDWQIVKNISKSWNIKDSIQVSTAVIPLLQRLTESWNTIQEDLNISFEDLKQKVNSSEFVSSLENSLRDQGVPFSGEFPQYDIPPFKLNISLDSFEARLSLGRKHERTSALHPLELAKWVSIRYKKLTGRKFNQTTFMKELLEAYSYSNRLVYREKDIAWGRAVPLNDIYDLLTLKLSSKQDYPKQFYMYDLGLLKELSTISYEAYKFEFGYARNQSKAIAIVDSQGRESRISSLTIYKEGEI
jgi:hypothetical protein